jgi:hypothetical protein
MNKEDFFNKYQDKIFEIARRGGKELSKQLTKVLKGLETKDGYLIRSDKNVKVLKALTLIIAQYMKRQGQSILKFLIGAFDELAKVNADYFKLEDFEGIKKNLLENVGIIGDKIKKDSAIFNLVKDNGVTKSVIFVVQKAIRAKILATDLINKVIDLIAPKVLTNPSVLVTQLVKNGGFNFLQIQDRMIARELANEIGFTHGVYAGTKMARTRDFCAARLNRIYTVKEIESWDKLQWSGKFPNHKSINDCGGFSCRHHLNFISEETALRLAKTRNKPINSYNTI